MHEIGFMQGRFSPLVEGKIQAFPWDNWEKEFAFAREYGFALMEWTLDQARLYENPLMTEVGQARIRTLAKENGVNVQSLTGDCFMQAPFYKANGSDRRTLLADLAAIISSCGKVNIRYLLIPLVDNGRIENDDQEASLRAGLDELGALLQEHSVMIVFESDFPPERLARFMEGFTSERFGINYDIGNSASLGFDPRAEIQAYGQRIVNVHVKDRLLGGTTVPLGTGNANFPVVFEELGCQGYRGDFILQTARAQNDDHAAPLVKYRDMVNAWIRHGFGA